MPVPSLPFLRTDKTGDVIVQVHVMPNAAQTQVQGLHDGALRLRLQAPPLEGKANQALQAWLAKTLAIPRSQITLERGLTSRRKQLRVAQASTLNARWDALNPPY